MRGRLPGAAGGLPSAQYIDQRNDVVELDELLQRCECVLRGFRSDPLRMARAVDEFALQVVPRELAPGRPGRPVHANLLRASIDEAHLHFDETAAAGAALFELRIVAPA